MPHAAPQTGQHTRFHWCHGQVCSRRRLTFNHPQRSSTHSVSSAHLEPRRSLCLARSEWLLLLGLLLLLLLPRGGQP